MLGLCRNDQTKAYPFALMPDGAVINDLVGSDPVVVLFRRRVAHGLGLFQPTRRRPLELLRSRVRGTAAGRIHGCGDGFALEHARRSRRRTARGGGGLAQVPAYNAMWFAWTAYWPDTEVWQPGEGILGPEDIEQIEQAATAIESSDAAPTSFALRQNFPNPFNAQTIIQYELPAAGPVRLSVFNATGQRSALVSRREPSGRAILATLGRAQRRRGSQWPAARTCTNWNHREFIQARGMVLGALTPSAERT